MVYKETDSKSFIEHWSVWIPFNILLKIENWKNCNKIFFKYVISAVESIFNENFIKKEVCGRGGGVPWTSKIFTNNDNI